MSHEYDGELRNALWYKSSHSAATRECVEVAFLNGGRTGVRDSKDPIGPALIFAPRAWAAFTDAIGDSKLGDTG